MTLDIPIHKKILTAILKDIYGDTTLSTFLGFKGGTAASFFYELDRFSVDLDFDLLGVGKDDFVFEKVKKILEQYGTVKDASKKRYNLFYLLSYDGKMPSANNVKVEINRRNFGSRYHGMSYLGISMNVMVKEDMVAHKLVAMYERFGKTNRDIFDVWFFLKHNWQINDAIIMKRTAMPVKVFLKRCIELLENMDNSTILAGLGELLTPKQKVWAKAHLREDAIFHLKLLLEHGTVVN